MIKFITSRSVFCAGYIAGPFSLFFLQGALSEMEILQEDKIQSLIQAREREGEPVKRIS